MPCPGRLFGLFWYVSTDAFLSRVVLPQGDSMRTLALGGHVGFDSLPDQLVNKEVNKGFDFNILCVGEWWVGVLCLTLGV